VAFIAKPEWTTRKLLSWSHPRKDWGSLRDRRNRCRAVRRAADKIADRIHGLIWRRRSGVLPDESLICINKPLENRLLKSQ
jgi:hypothetical protein